MRFSIRTLQVPTKWGAGAFSPGLTQGGASATNGQNKVIGMPGTVPVPSPAPPALDDSALGGPFNQPSKVSPDVFYPSIYYNPPNPSLHFPGQVFGDNVLPVPAVAQGRYPLQWQHRSRIGGRTTTTSNRPFTQWPTYSGRAS
jgi:hypothetical protein